MQCHLHLLDEENGGGARWVLLQASSAVLIQNAEAAGVECFYIGQVSFKSGSRIRLVSQYLHTR